MIYLIVLTIYYADYIIVVLSDDMHLNNTLQ